MGNEYRKKEGLGHMGSMAYIVQMREVSLPCPTLWQVLDRNKDPQGKEPLGNNTFVFQGIVFQSWGRIISE